MTKVRQQDACPTNVPCS